MKLSEADRRMLLNAKGYIQTVSRRAETAKDGVLAHRLADIAAELHTIMQNPVKEPVRVLAFGRKT